MCKRLRLMVSVLVLLASTVRAGSIDVRGAIEIIAAPPLLDEGVVESSATMFAFVEQAGFALESNQPVNITGPGLVDQGSDLTAGSIPAGTIVNVYFLHFDPLDGQGVVALSGSMTFQFEILGIIILSSTLSGSDDLGAPGTRYVPVTNRGLELGPVPPGDNLLVSDDLRTVTVQLATEPAVDQIRVITAFRGEVPCPADIDGDGVVGVLDLVELIENWGQGAGPADVTGDGTVDVLDLVTVVTRWGPCPG